MKFLLALTLTLTAALLPQAQGAHLKNTGWAMALTARGDDQEVRCPEGTMLCIWPNGRVCVAYNDGGHCCDDGSGFCSGGFTCGTGLAANYCCEPGLTPEQCALATSAGTETATYVEPTPV